MAGKRSKSGIGLSWFMAGLIAFEIAAVLLFVPANKVRDYNAAERAAIALNLGVETERHVYATANNWYRATLVKPGFVKALNEFLFNTNSPESMKNYSVTTFASSRITAFWRVLYSVYYRASTIWLWIPYLLPIAVPTLIDAIQARRVRQWRFSYVSPMTRSIATRAKLIIVSLLVIALLLPLHVPATIYPVLFAVLMMANWVWVANLQKRI